MPSPPYTAEVSFAGFQAGGQDTTGLLATDDPIAPPPPAMDVGPRPYHYG